MSNILGEQKRKHTLFFEKVVEEFKIEKSNIDIIAVLHILPDALFFSQALSRIGNIKLIIPKPKSINYDIYNQLIEKGFNIDKNIKRKDISKIFNSIQKRTLLIDIGGYFSGVEKHLKKDKNIIGVVEDTENGLQKYLENGISIPFQSVARSPLKYNEDILVGKAIVYSLERILREHNMIINGRQAAVIGYGKIGMSVAKNLQSEDAVVKIYDQKNVKNIQVISDGFLFGVSKEKVLSESDLICLATGNKSLSDNDWGNIKNGAFVFSVTSSDDEIDKFYLESKYKKEKVSRYVDRYFFRDRHFYLINGGNTINFIHGTTVSDFILLVHAEILVLGYYLILNGEITEDKDEAREKIAKIWLEIFKN